MFDALPHIHHFLRLNALDPDDYVINIQAKTEPAKARLEAAIRRTQFAQTWVNTAVKEPDFTDFQYHGIRVTLSRQYGPGNG